MVLHVIWLHWVQEMSTRAVAVIQALTQRLLLRQRWACCSPNQPPGCRSIPNLNYLVISTGEHLWVGNTVDCLNKPMWSCMLRVGVLILTDRVGCRYLKKTQQTRASLVSKQPFLFITSCTVVFLHAAHLHALFCWAATVYRTFVSLYRYSRGIGLLTQAGHWYDRRWYAQF